MVYILKVGSICCLFALLHASYLDGAENLAERARKLDRFSYFMHASYSKAPTSFVRGLVVLIT